MKRRIVTIVKWGKFHQWLGVLPPEFQEPLDRGRHNPWPAQIVGLEAVGIGDEGDITIRVSNEPFTVNQFSMDKIKKRLTDGLLIPKLASSVISPANGLFCIKFKVTSRGFCCDAIHIVVGILVGFGYLDFRAPEITQRTQVFVENNDLQETQVGEWVTYGEYLMKKCLKDLKWQQ